MEKGHIKTLAFGVTRAEAQRIREAAKRDGRTVSNFVRLTLLRTLAAKSASADAATPTTATPAAPTGTVPFCSPASTPSTNGQPDVEAHLTRR